MQRLLAFFDPADQESLENRANLGKTDNPGRCNHGTRRMHGKRQPSFRVFCVFRGRNLTSAPELTKSPRTFHSVISVTLCFPAFFHRQVVRATLDLVFTLVRVTCVPWLSSYVWDLGDTQVVSATPSSWFA